MKKAYVIILTMLIAKVVYPEVTLDTLHPLAVTPLSADTLDTQDLTVEQLAQLKLSLNKISPDKLAEIGSYINLMDKYLVEVEQLTQLKLSLNKISPDKLAEIGSYINLMAKYLAEVDVPRHSYYWIRFYQILNQVSKAEDFTPEMKAKLDDLIARINKLRGRNEN
jgi:hypothetical protein